MSKFCFALVAATLLAGNVSAAELKSGLQPGDSVGAFEVEKVAGAKNDNVEVGKNLCYRCMLGSKPVVMVFSRKSDKAVAGLVKELDATLAKNTDKKLSSFVNVIGGDDADKLKAEAKKLEDSAKPENVAIVVPHDGQDGPSEFGISPDAEVTVMLYVNGTVAANHAFAPGKLDSKGIAAVIADTAKILN